ncbi:hypothetical protein D3C72_1400500 [compost metagenome]
MDDALIGEGLAYGLQRDGLAALGRVQRQRRGHAGRVQFDFESAVHDLADGALDRLRGSPAQIDEGQDRVAVQRLGRPALRHGRGDEGVPVGQIGIEDGGIGIATVGFVGDGDVGLLVRCLGSGRGSDGLRRAFHRCGTVWRRNVVGPGRRRIDRRQDVGLGIQQQLERVFCAHLTLSPAWHEAARFNHLVIQRNITSYS